MSESKELLEATIKGLEEKLNSLNADLRSKERELADVNKVALLPSQFDDIYEAIESGISEYDFSDTENFEIEYGIDYDGKVNCENHEFNNNQDLVEMINDKIQALFKEVECPEEDVTKAS